MASASLRRSSITRCRPTGCSLTCSRSTSAYEGLDPGRAEMNPHISGDRRRGGVAALLRADRGTGRRRRTAGRTNVCARSGVNARPAVRQGRRRAPTRTPAGAPRTPPAPPETCGRRLRRGHSGARVSRALPQMALAGPQRQADPSGGCQFARLSFGRFRRLPYQSWALACHLGTPWSPRKRDPSRDVGGDPPRQLLELRRRLRCVV